MMYDNPLGINLKDLSEKDVRSKIDELSKKYFMAKNNHQVQQQILNLIHFYQDEIKTRKAAEIEQQKKDNPGLDDLININ